MAISHMSCFMSKQSSDQYVLLLPRSLVTLRHRCVIMHEVDAYKDRLPTTRHYFLKEIKVNVSLGTRR